MQQRQLYPIIFFDFPCQTANFLTYDGFFVQKAQECIWSETMIGGKRAEVGRLLEPIVDGVIVETPFGYVSQ